MVINFVTVEELLKVKDEILDRIDKKLCEGSSGSSNFRWIRAKELKRITGWSDSTVQTNRINGTLKFSKISGSIFYDLHHLQSILERNAKHHGNNE